MTAAKSSQHSALKGKGVLESGGASGCLTQCIFFLTYYLRFRIQEHEMTCNAQFFCDWVHVQIIPPLFCICCVMLCCCSYCCIVQSVLRVPVPVPVLYCL